MTSEYYEEEGPSRTKTDVTQLVQANDGIVPSNEGGSNPEFANTGNLNEFASSLQESEQLTARVKDNQFKIAKAKSQNAFQGDLASHKNGNSNSFQASKKRSQASRQHIQKQYGGGKALTITAPMGNKRRSTNQNVVVNQAFAKDKRDASPTSSITHRAGELKVAESTNGQTQKTITEQLNLIEGEPLVINID